MLVDSHCHLNFPEFENDLDGVIARAKAAGVGTMQTICTSLSEFEEIHAIAEKYEHVYCSAGVHPNEKEITESQTLIELTSRNKVIGLGETGLDYYREHSKELQMKNFQEHIKASQATGIPLIVHSRSADEDTVVVLQKYMEKKPFTGLIHCFTGTQVLAEGALHLGFYISFSGVITFKNSSKLYEIAKNIPLNRLLVETDAPYLAPVPHRGKPNEPAFVVCTNRVLAEVKGISEAECARATTENFFRLFQKAKQPKELAA